ncbi:alpha/beta fold hydrolase [Streptomyces sp. JNUCC 64]
MPDLTAPDGTRLAYHPSGTGEPLLCLPGGPMQDSGYLGDLGGLGARHRLVRLDLRGTGDSADPADPATQRCDRQTGDVEALRLRLGPDRVDLLGHSAGGDLALSYAVRHPHRVRRLVLVAAPARALGVPDTREDRRAALALRVGEPWYPAAYEAWERVWSGTATWADREAVDPSLYGRWDAEAQAHAAAERAQRHPEAAFRYGGPGAFDPAAARAALACLEAPVLVVAGELDGGPSPRAARECAGLFPRARLVVLPGAGHYPWLDAPEPFVRAVTAFLAGEPVGEEPTGPTGLVLRPARRGELPRLQEIETAAGRAFADAGMPEIAADDPPTLAELARFAARGSCWVAAPDGGAPVAYLLAEPVDGALHVEQVSVHPDAARRGVGRALLDHAEAHAVAVGAGALTLTTFTDVPWNAPYYARIGFRPLTGDELTPGLREIREREAEHGLDRWPRTVMRRPVGSRS